MDTPIVEKVVKQLKAMPEELQQRVLEFTRSLAESAPRGVPGRQLLQYAGALPPDELELMRQAISQDCEQVDADAW